MAQTLNFRLNNWQTVIAKDKHRFLVLNIGRRGGKSTFCALKMFVRATKMPNATIYYVSPSYRQSKAIMWEMLNSMIPRDILDGKPNETELSFRFKNGARIELKGADVDPDKLRGVKIDFLVCDEVASFRNWDTVWNKVLRPTLADSRGSAIFISTPQGFNFWYDMYNTKDEEYSSYSFSSYENNFIDPAELEKIRLELDDDTFRQEIMAQFTQVSGVVYKEWNFAKQFIPLEYDFNLPVHITIDYGVNDPTSIVWLQRHGSEIRAIDFYETNNADIAHYAQVINSKPYQTSELITGDPYSGDSRNITTNTTPNDEFRKYGIYIKAPVKMDIPNQIRVAHKYIKNLYVSDKLKRLRDCIHNYRYPTKKENTVNQSNELPIHDEFSHAMRALEYYFLSIDGKKKA